MATTCPISKADVKLHLRVDHTDDDDLIEQIMLAATEWAENYQRRTYITRSRTYYLDEFPEVFRPPFSPLVTITSIKYYDTDGVQQTLDSAQYRVDTATEPGRVTEAYNCNWPDIRSMTNAIEVIYTSGYGAAGDVPDDIKAALKMLIAHLYEDRQAVIDKNLYEVPLGVKTLLTMRRMI